MRCINCNEEIHQSMKFCPYCGTSQEQESYISSKPQIAYCNNCNREILPTDKFCPFCGDSQKEIWEHWIQEPPRKIRSLEKKVTLPRAPGRGDIPILLLPAIVWIAINAFMNFGGFLIAQILVGVFLQVSGVSTTDDWSDSTKNIVNLVFNILIDGLALFFIFGFLLGKLGYQRSDIGIKENVLFPNLRNSLKGYIAAFGVTFFIGILLQTVIDQIWKTMGWSTQQETPYDRYLEGEAVSTFLFFIVLVIVAPISEEIIYRGLLMRLLDDRGFSPFGTIVLSSLIFAAVHTEADITAGTFNYAITHFFGTFCIGLTLAAAYRYTKNLGVPILIHAINNGFAGISMLAIQGDYSVETENTILSILGMVILSMIVAFFIILYLDRKSIPILLSDLNSGLKNVLNAEGAFIFGFVALVAIVIPVSFDWISDIAELSSISSTVIWIVINLIILIVSLKGLTMSNKLITNLNAGKTN
ncbi:MAG: type II CAAX prenyl endopeptidase Rce1 family protein [Promethearchaeota archaeon]